MKGAQHPAQTPPGGKGIPSSTPHLQWRLRRLKSRAFGAPPSPSQNPE